MLPTLLLAASAHAGTPPSAITVEVGYRQIQVDDALQSPAPYQGHAASLDLGADLRLSDRTRTMARLHGSAGSLGAPSLDWPDDRASLAIDAGASITLATRVWSGERSTLALGGSVQHRLWYGDAVAYHPWGLGLTSLDLHASLRRDLGAGWLRAHVDVPLAGLATRHVWALDPVDPQRGDFSAFYAQGTRPVVQGQVLTARGGVEGWWPLREGGRTRFGGSVGAGFLHNPQPKPATLLDLHVTTGLRVDLGGSR